MADSKPITHFKNSLSMSPHDNTSDRFLLTTVVSLLCALYQMDTQWFGLIAACDTLTRHFVLRHSTHTYALAVHTVLRTMLLGCKASVYV